ncbi:Uncharacterized protein Adt_35195 [Abeliophyllum distichum]|uniref:Retrotransposon gag protein n=1 Tax=Abeliophyllum distichum TaxID=126358 RepID=A0ABD1QHH3_9LAMI
MHQVDTGSLVLAKIDALAKQMESLKQSQSANMIQMSLPICITCGANHQSSECPLTKIDMSSPEQVAYAQNFQRQQNNPYSQTYNPGWRNYPNFSYGNTQNIQNLPNQGRPQEREGGLEETVAKLTERMEMVFTKVQKRQDVAIKNMENQIRQLAKMLTERQPGTWPSNTEVNPKEQVNAITTRSGAELPEFHVKRPGVDKKTASSKERERPILKKQLIKKKKALHQSISHHRLTCLQFHFLKGCENISYASNSRNSSKYSKNSKSTYLLSML